MTSLTAVKLYGVILLGLHIRKSYNCNMMQTEYAERLNVVINTTYRALWELWSMRTLASLANFTAT